MPSLLHALVHTVNDALHENDNKKITKVSSTNIGSLSLFGCMGLNFIPIKSISKSISYSFSLHVF